MNKRGFIVFVGLLSILSGCAAIKSVRFDENNASQSGVPYNLPKSIVKVALIVNRNDPNARLTLTTSSEIVPDEKAVFYARTNSSIWTDSNHHIILQNGLLNSIDTIDDGKAGEVLNNVAQTVVNLKKISAGRSESAVGDSPFTTAEPFPTQEEILAILALIDIGQFTFQPEGTWKSVPGTAEILVVRSELSSELPDSSAGAPSSHRYQTGVFTRTLKAETIETKVAIDMEKLYDRRIAVTETECNEGERQKTVIDSNVKLHKIRKKFCESPEPKKLKKELEDQLDKISRIGILDDAEKYTDRRDFLEGKLKQIATQKTKCAVHKEELYRLENNQESANQKVEDLENLLSYLRSEKKQIEGKKFILSRRKHPLMVVDTDKNLRVPISRAWIGKTINTVRFENGVLKDFHQTKPAEMLVATEATVKTTQTLWEGVLAVLRVPQVILGIEKDKKIAEVELTEQEIRHLEQKLHVVATETKIEEIKAQVQLILQQTNLEQVKQNPQDHMDQLDESAIEDESDDGGLGLTDVEDLEEGETDSSEEDVSDQETEDKTNQAEGSQTGEDTAIALPSSAGTEESITIGINADDGEESSRQKIQSLQEELALVKQMLLALTSEFTDQE